MENINSILIIVQVLLSISLIGLILIQQGKGASAGAAFGSGASATVFGSQGSGNFLSKSTAVLATLFFITCMALAYLGTNREVPNSVTDTAEPIMQPADSIMQPTKNEPSDVPPAVDSDSAIQTMPGLDGSTNDLPPAE